MCFVWSFNFLKLLFCSPETLVFPNLSEEKLWNLEKKIKAIVVCLFKNNMQQF